MECLNEFIARNQLNCISHTNSLALSVKMNILLFIPGYAVILYETLGFTKTLGHGILILLIQVYSFICSNIYLKLNLDRLR